MPTFSRQVAGNQYCDRAPEDNNMMKMISISHKRRKRFCTDNCSLWGS